MSNRTVRFGDFEVDLRAGELLKRGHKIKLQEKPFQILEILLEQPGEMVSREEVTKRLWPDDTFVDFERGLNTAIGKLRTALGDSAEKTALHRDGRSTGLSVHRQRATSRWLNAEAIP